MPDEKVKWPSNSNASKNEQNVPEKKEPPKLKGTASVKKKNLATKFAEAFVVDDVKNVGKSLVYDILIPAIKDTISKMVSNGVDSMLFGGEKRRGDVYRDRERTFITDYSGASKRNRDNRSSSPKGRTADFSDVQDVCYDYREDAEEILRSLKADIADYDVVSVKAYAAYAKLKDLHFDYPMADYGWNDLSEAYIDRYRDGYHLILPRPKLIR